MLFPPPLGAVGRTVVAYTGDMYLVQVPASAGLIFIFRGIVPKYQNFLQLMPESVLKNSKIVRNLSQKKVSKNSVIYHNVRATLSG